MNCCIHCFNDEHTALINFIKQYGTPNGSCNFCGAVRAQVIEPHTLKPLFAPLLTFYEPLEIGENLFPDEDWIDKGESFATLVDNELGVFSDDVIPKRDELIEAIFTNQEQIPLPGDPEPGYGFGADNWWCDREQNFSERPSWVIYWQQFSDHLRHEWRFIIDEKKHDIEDPRYWLPPLLDRLEQALPAGSHFYRGRTEVHTLTEMGAPPPDRARAGRANPPGIPFLYLSTDPDTVIAELRPWKGQHLTVAEFELLESVKVIDLTRASQLKTPFGHPVSKDLYQLRDHYHILASLSELLSIPINPEVVDIEYLPTQYLTEIIRHEGYDGMIFNSAMGPRHNLVLFSPAIARAIKREIVRVTNIGYHWEKDSKHSI